MKHFILSSFILWMMSTSLFCNNDDKKLALKDFTVIQNGTKTDIKWTLNREPLGTYFTVEKSADGKIFSKVIDMPVSEKGNLYEEYIESDYQPYKGISYYRIKQTDDAGNTYYSDIITLRYSEEQTQHTKAAIPKDEPNVMSAIANMDGREGLFVLRDFDGNDYCAKITLGKEDTYLYAKAKSAQIAAGIYRIVGTTNNQLYSLKVVVK